MAKNNNLTDFLINTANAIRTVEGSTDVINPQDFEDRIKNLSGLPNGKKWTKGNIAGNIKGYVHGLWFLTNTIGLHYSIDGRNWFTATDNSGAVLNITIYDISYFSGIFFIIASTGVYRSEDGKSNWELNYSRTISSSVSPMTRGGSLIAFKDGSSFFYSSRDGNGETDWEMITDHISSSNTLIYYDGYWVSGFSYLDYQKIWQPIPGDYFNDDVSKFLVLNGLLIAATYGHYGSQDYDSIYYTTNILSGFTEKTFYADGFMECPQPENSCIINNRFYIPIVSSGVEGLYFYYTDDFINYYGTSFHYEFGGRLEYGNGVYFIDGGNRLYYSTDGINFFDSEENADICAYNNYAWIIRKPDGFYHSNDGINWSSINTSLTSSIYFNDGIWLAKGGDGYIYYSIGWESAK